MHTPPLKDDMGHSAAVHAISLPTGTPYKFTTRLAAAIICAYTAADVCGAKTKQQHDHALSRQRAQHARR
jgi:hypothetical protein